MKTSEAGKRYAKAIYELAKDHKSNDKVFDELRALKDALRGDINIKSFILSPVVPTATKAELIKKALAGKISEEVISALCLMIEKGRVKTFFDVVDSYEKISDDDHGVTRGIVKSAAHPSVEAIKKIEEKVTAVTGKKVILKFEEDPKLLGGMVAEVNGWTFDDSLESHLTRLNEELNRRAN